MSFIAPFMALHLLTKMRFIMIARMLQEYDDHMALFYLPITFMTLIAFYCVATRKRENHFEKYDETHRDVILRITCICITFKTMPHTNATTLRTTFKFRSDKMTAWKY